MQVIKYWSRLFWSAFLLDEIADQLTTVDMSIVFTLPESLKAS